VGEGGCVKIPIRIHEHKSEPLYQQIKVQLRGLILGGQLPEGMLLPSIRELAGHLNCSVITIRRVYQDLELEGLLRTKQGTGTFVAAVDQAVRESFRRETVKEAFENAVDTGISVHLTGEEMIEIFEKVLKQKTGYPPSESD
jgi:GntR family transcriptional regulator